MSRRVTISDVAQAAGVHKATVARAMNPRTTGLVNAATLKRVQRAARELGYVPNAIARSLSTDSSMSVGLIVPDLTNPIFPPIARGIESYLSPRGYTALIVNTDGRADLESDVFTSLTERRVDGFIMATGRNDHPLLREARERGVPVVLVNRSVSGVDYPEVAPDMVGGIRLAFEHLAGLGHRRLLHFAGPTDFTIGNARADSFRQVATNLRLSVKTTEARALSIAAGQEMMDAALERGLPSETALVASNDLLAFGALLSLRKHGFHCPADFSVTGFNDIAFAELGNPPLTTLRVPYFKMGSEAARLLVDAITGETAYGVVVLLAAELIVRESTAPPRSV
jgi:LacI family transcriptional regulator